MARRPILLPLGTPNDGTATLDARPDNFASALPKIEENLQDLHTSLGITRRANLVLPIDAPGDNSPDVRGSRPDTFRTALPKIDDAFKDVFTALGFSNRIPLVRPTESPNDGTATLGSRADSFAAAIQKIDANFITVFSTPTIQTLGSITRTKDGSTGTTYTLTPATWSSGSATRQWYRRHHVTGIDTLIGGATNTTYVAQGADEGYDLVCKETNSLVVTTARAPGPVLPVPILFDGGFDDATTGWTTNNSAILSTDTSRKIQGTGAQLTTLGGVATGITNTKATITGTFDPATFGVCVFWSDFGNDPADQEFTGVTCRFGRSNTYWTSLTFGTSGQDDKAIGGRWNVLNASEITSPTVFTSAGSGSLQLRTLPSANGPGGGKAIVDALCYQAGGRPTLLMTFDDICIEQYTVALPIMQTYGLVGTLFVAPGYMDGGVSKLTIPMMQALVAAGWGAECNGSYDDTPMTSAASVAAAISGANGIDAVKAFLITNNLNPTPQHGCYPNGNLRSTTPTPVDVASVTQTSGSAVITMASTAGISAGWRATGYLVPAGTNVLTVDSGTQITLTANLPTSQTKAMRFTNQSDPFYMGKLQDALDAAGYKTMRQTNTGLVHSRFGVGSKYRALQFPGYSGSLQTSAQMLADVDSAILRGCTIMRYFHMIADTGSGLRTLVAEFTNFCAGVASRRDAGNLDILTIPQWWLRDGGASCPL